MNQELKNTLEALYSQKLMLYPTDTIWGIGGDATDENVIQAVTNLKGWKENRMGYVMLVHPDYIHNYVDVDLKVLQKIFDSIEGPVTFRFENPRNIPESLIQMGNNTVALRIPYHNQFLMKVLLEFGKPIISTSANITNNPFPNNFDEIDERIKNGVDYVVDPSLDEGCGKPSTIIAYSDNTIFR